MDNNNVIPFPNRRKHTRVEEPRQKVSFDLERKKIMISASLFSFLFVMVVANQQFFNNIEKKNSIHRGIASVEGQRDTAWEHALAKKLHNSSLRTTASVGDLPTTKDKFKYEALKGNYIVRFADNGSVKELTYVDNAVQDSHPRQVASIDRFIEANRHVFPDFDNLEAFNTKGQVDSNKLQLKLKGEKVATVDFRLDQNKNLLHLSVNTQN